MQPKSWEGAARHVGDEVVELIIQKQRAYGPSNIEATALTGLYIRLRDKLGRFETELKKAVAAGDDPLRVSKLLTPTARDNLIDIAGYGLLLLMWMDGTFHLPMEERGLSAKLGQPLPGYPKHPRADKELPKPTTPPPDYTPGRSPDSWRAQSP